MRYEVEVTIPAKIVLRAKVVGDDPEGAKEQVLVEAKRIAEEFSEKPILRGRWPEAFDGAEVEASPLPGADVSVELDEAR